MDRPTEPSAAPGAGAPSNATPAPPEPVQRWRITFGRDAVPPEAVGRAAIDAWGAALAGSGLSVAALGGPAVGDVPARPRFALAVPLPASCAGRAELAEVWLLERVPAWALRAALADRLPAGHRWVDAENVWLGAPPLAGQVVAAEWTVTLEPSQLDEARITSACRSVLAATTLPRVRAKPGGDRAYDLRPLLADVGVANDLDGRMQLRVVTRLDPALGSGRPEEVVAAVAEAAGGGWVPAIDSIVRDRLILADPAAAASADRAISPPRRPRRRS